MMPTIPWSLSADQQRRRFLCRYATLLKSQMEKIGVKVNIVMTDKPAWLDRFTRQARVPDGPGRLRVPGGH